MARKKKMFGVSKIKTAPKIPKMPTYEQMDDAPKMIAVKGTKKPKVSVGKVTKPRKMKLKGV